MKNREKAKGEKEKRKLVLLFSLSSKRVFP
jgi:hypothetical protein